MKSKLGILGIFFLFSCTELQQVVNQLPSSTGEVTPTEMAMGLKQALEFGVSEGVDLLHTEDGYFKDQAVKILLPEELRKVDKALRDIGLSSLADEGLKLLNRAAEDAVKEATPIFVNAVKGITFNDAKQILLS